MTEAARVRGLSLPFTADTAKRLPAGNAAMSTHEVVNINLKDRPAWSKDVLPEGTVPVLVQDDKLISGSMAIAEYLEEAYPETKPMLPKDPYLRALDRSFLDTALPAIHSVLSVLMGRGSKEENWTGLLQKISLYDKELAKRNTVFFSGEEPGFVDYVTWPVFVLARGISAVHTGLEMPSAETFPRFSSWSESMRADRCVREVVNEEHTVLFVQSYVTGLRDFNAGLH